MLWLDIRSNQVRLESVKSEILRFKNYLVELNRNPEPLL